MAYKSYGYIRIVLYAFGAVSGAILGSLLIFGVARFIPLLRIVGLNIGLDIIVVSLCAGVTSFWLVNHFLTVPFRTVTQDLGFVAQVPNRALSAVFIKWNELEKFANLGIGIYVAARSSNGRYYRFIFGKDTDGYYRFTHNIRQHYEKVHSRR